MAKSEGVPHQVLEVKETGDLLKLMDRIPEVLREKYCKKAIRKATQLMRSTAQKNARKLPHEWERWGKIKEPVKLHKSIKRSTPRTTGTTVKGVVFTDGQARMYAAPVEYGHRMFLPGSDRQQGTVPRSQFWRPAIDSTEKKQQAIIIAELKKMAKELAQRTDI